MKSYGSITASVNYQFVRWIIKTLAVIVILAVVSSEIYSAVYLHTPSTVSGWELFIVLPSGIYSFMKIAGYSKREIVDIMRPSSKKGGILNTVKTVLSHPIEMIMIPLLISVSIYFAISAITNNVLAPYSIIFVAIYAIQILPLSIKKEQYLRIANQSIIDARDHIRVARMIMMLPDLPKEEYEQAVKRHIAAEEALLVHSEFLVLSAGMSTILVTGIRYALPIMTTAGGVAIQILYLSG